MQPEQSQHSQIMREIQRHERGGELTFLTALSVFPIIIIAIALM